MTTLASYGSGVDTSLYVESITTTFQPFTLVRTGAYQKKVTSGARAGEKLARSATDGKLKIAPEGAHSRIGPAEGDLGAGVSPVGGLARSTRSEHPQRPDGL